MKALLAALLLLAVLFLAAIAYAADSLPTAQQQRDRAGALRIATPVTAPQYAARQRLYRAASDHVEQLLQPGDH